MNDPVAHDPRSAVIYHTLAQLIAGEQVAHIATNGQGDMLDQIIEQLNRLTAHLAARQALLLESEQRFEEFLEVISGMAALDFSRKAYVGENDTIIDAMALGINMLSEELASSVVSRAYVNNIIEALLDALIVVDQQGAITTVNEAAVRLFGYAREELVEQPFALLFIQPELIEIEAWITTPGSYELNCRSSTGRIFPAALVVSAMLPQDDGAQGLVCTIRDLTSQKQAEEALQRNVAQEKTIRAQAVALVELSTPLIPLSEQVVVMPLIGAVDSRRAQQVLETLLQGIAGSRASVAILDITGVPVVDSQVANALIHAAQAARLLGAQVMLTGIRPEVAQTLVGLGIDLGGIITRSTLQSGIAAVLKKH